jgi:hypothetical protein
MKFFLLKYSPCRPVRQHHSFPTTTTTSHFIASTSIYQSQNSDLNFTADPKKQTYALQCVQLTTTTHKAAE